MGGISGSYEVTCRDAVAIAALEALADVPGHVYCEDAFGGGSWIAITHVSWTLLGTREHPRRHATLDYAEVESGLAMDA